MHFWYTKLRGACTDCNHVDVHFFDSLSAVAWFLRFSKKSAELYLWYSDPFHAGWITRTDDTYTFDVEAYKVNWIRFIRHKKIVWNEMSDRMFCGLKADVKGTKRYAFSVYNSTDD